MPPNFSSREKFQPSLQREMPPKFSPPFPTDFVDRRKSTKHQWRESVTDYRLWKHVYNLKCILCVWTFPTLFLMLLLEWQSICIQLNITFCRMPMTKVY
jgi:hypothetical protein